jgi:Protein of unknown function (DUF3887)
MRVLAKLTIVAILAGLALPQAAGAQATPAPTVTPDSALTARFSTFLTDVLAGRLPPAGISDAMKTALTPNMLAQIDAMLAPLGTFQKLQFVREDAVQGYQRYHYVAVFDKGTQPLMFVLDSNGNIAGFFKDQSQ